MMSTFPCVNPCRYLHCIVLLIPVTNCKQSTSKDSTLTQLKD